MCDEARKEGCGKFGERRHVKATLVSRKWQVSEDERPWELMIHVVSNVGERRRRSRDRRRLQQRAKDSQSCSLSARPGLYRSPPSMTQDMGDHASGTIATGPPMIGRMIVPRCTSGTHTNNMRVFVTLVGAETAIMADRQVGSQLMLPWH